MAERGCGGALDVGALLRTPEPRDVRPTPASLRRDRQELNTAAFDPFGTSIVTASQDQTAKARPGGGRGRLLCRGFPYEEHPGA